MTSTTIRRRPPSALWGVMACVALCFVASLPVVEGAEERPAAVSRIVVVRPEVTAEPIAFVASKACNAARPYSRKTRRLPGGEHARRNGLGVPLLC